MYGCTEREDERQAKNKTNKRKIEDLPLKGLEMRLVPLASILPQYTILAPGKFSGRLQ